MKLPCPAAHTPQRVTPSPNQAKQRAAATKLPLLLMAMQCRVMSVLVGDTPYRQKPQQHQQQQQQEKSKGKVLLQ
jgi:hypothetical protein